MKIIKSIFEMQSYSDKMREEGKTIAFVPTMGNLHDGHISLVKKARELGNIVVVSIFVNPSQFSPNEDYNSYPRTFEEDKTKLKKENTDIIFFPTANEMYDNPKTYVYVEDYSRILCGKSRPTHFRGVTTVVSKLFNIVKPHVAVFGEKDAQQAFIIKKMVKDLNFDIRIETGKIMRETNGLALSSRNAYLTDEEHSKASFIYKSLKGAEDMVYKGEKNPENIVAFIKNMLNEKKVGKIDYVEIVNDDNFLPTSTIAGNIRILVAIYVGKTRLIDNIKVSL